MDKSNKKQENRENDRNIFQEFDLSFSNRSSKSKSGKVSQKYDVLKDKYNPDRVPQEVSEIH